MNSGVNNYTFVMYMSRRDVEREGRVICKKYTYVPFGVGNLCVDDIHTVREAISSSACGGKAPQQHCRLPF